MSNGTITMTGAEYDALAGKIAALEAERDVLDLLCQERFDELAMLQAELARLRAGQEPVLYVNGEHLALMLDNPDKEGRSASASTVKGHYCDTPLYTTPQPSAVPAGWKLVPVEPTPEMIRTAEEAHMPFGDMDIALRMAILSAPSALATVQSVNQQLLEALDGLVSWAYRNNQWECTPMAIVRSAYAIAAARQDGKA